VLCGPTRRMSRGRRRAGPRRVLDHQRGSTADASSSHPATGARWAPAPPRGRITHRCARPEPG